ncbi:uncharacterized protein K452DRAFT_299782 [Aplosporella prunicola CBS 121167]|uniref:Uncharacterized protein n=1 Tax=Aplosporella prunicola CBS 121167 TaxID=1176127 RepID=A0A6A6B8B1_9PEZI|nr:uncharacterized protein K452DRAFT_299782 [Aplosporella prunicola CBS 121167]KAF2139788.1 hypothetical protein K452DRAFT_299782 [Aplosporella prunicola CBS 121167]
MSTLESDGTHIAERIKNLEGQLHVRDQALSSNKTERLLQLARISGLDTESKKQSEASGKKTCSERDAEIEDLKLKHRNFQTQIEALEIDEHRVRDVSLADHNEVRDLQSKCWSRDERIRKLEADVKSQDGKIKHLKTRVSAGESKSQQLEADKVQQAERIHRIEDCNSRYEALIGDKDNQLHRAESGCWSLMRLSTIAAVRDQMISAKNDMEFELLVALL